MWSHDGFHTYKTAAFYAEQCTNTSHFHIFEISQDAWSTQTPFSFVHMCAHSSITILKIAELEVQSVCMGLGSMLYSVCMSGMVRINVTKDCVDGIQVSQTQCFNRCLYQWFFSQCLCYKCNTYIIQLSQGQDWRQVRKPDECGDIIFIVASRMKMSYCALLPRLWAMLTILHSQSYDTN